MAAEVDVLPVVVRADDVPGPPQGCWTYDDYAAIPDDGRRYEIIDGVLYMTPAPQFDHQQSSMRFSVHLYPHLEGAGIGYVVAAPFDVQLPSGAVVQPDIVVVLAEHAQIITRTRILGTPDLVVEISSPSTAGHDRRRKQDTYARAGVPEYWIADPRARTIEVLMLENGEYRSAGVFEGEAKLPSRVVPDLPVPVDQFFA